MASGGLYSPPTQGNTLSPETLKFINNTAQQFGADVGWAAQKIIYEGQNFIPELDEKPHLTSQSLGYNPFRAGVRTPQQIELMLQEKGWELRGSGTFLEGKGNYHNPKTERSYHYDPHGKGKYPEEPSHIDVHRSPTVRQQRKKAGLSKKRKYPID